jgi:hypothetical protein
MHRMRPHQPLQHRLEHLLLLVGVFGEAERSARVHQRVLADEVFDLRLGLVVERVIGGAHVGELGVAALRVHHPRRQQRELCRDRAERAVGVPQAIAEIEQIGAAVLRQRLAVLAEVGDVVEARGEAVFIGLGDVAAAGVLALTEVQGEGHLLLVGDVLVVEHQHRVFVHGGLDLACFGLGERLAQIEAGHLADEVFLQLPDGDRHDVLSRVSRAVGPALSTKKLLRRSYLSTRGAHASHAFRAISPPSTGITAPVRKDAAGRHRLKVICATSSGSP